MNPPRPKPLVVAVLFALAEMRGQPTELWAYTLRTGLIA